MIHCGLKFTHDGAIALIKDNELLFSIEIEKLSNNPRYAEIDDSGLIERVLNNEGFSIDDIDHFVVDGWGGTDEDSLAVQPRLRHGTGYNYLSYKNNGTSKEIAVNSYQESKEYPDILAGLTFNDFAVNSRSLKYSSYLHVTGHVLSAYMTSPFASKGLSSYVLVWDGGMYPLLYYFDADTQQVENLGPIFLLVGNIYTIFSQHFGPFKSTNSFAKDNLSIAGKVMAYIAYGNYQEELSLLFDEVISTQYDRPMGFANAFAREVRKRANGYSDDDILKTFHLYLENMVVEKLKKKLSRFPRKARNLCYAGGCALNIKWNSAIRRSGLFDDVYIPPFPNDSGSAIGMACASMLSTKEGTAIEWDVYSGPGITKNAPAKGWSASECDVSELASFLYKSNEPVVVLHGRAELGPRALGNRSILAAPGSPAMKDKLNEMKQREHYRPVSPICLERYAPEYFGNSSSDPYMLFDHQVRKEKLNEIAAVCHIDESARLQTIDVKRNMFLTDLLTKFHSLSGVPVLCNTSANFNGKGFFPDVQSATSWGGADYVWCEGTLYSKLK